MHVSITHLECNQLVSGIYLDAYFEDMHIYFNFLYIVSLHFQLLNSTMLNDGCQT